MAAVSRRWLLVGAGAAALIGVTQLPEPAAAARTVDAAELRRRIGAQAVPYVGYAESTAQLGLPEIPQLASVVMLLTGTTRIRANVAAPDRWRVDEVLIGRGARHLPARRPGVPVGLRGQPGHPRDGRRGVPAAARR